MYRAIGDDSAWRDGVFSHASPGQSYQASRQEYAGGSLGATSRLVSSARMQRDRANMGRRAMKGPAFRDGTLGAYGRAFRSGSLGDDVSTTPVTPAPSTINLPNSTTVTIGPNGASIAPTVVPTVPFYKTPAFMVGAAGAAAVVLYLALRK